MLEFIEESKHKINKSVIATTNCDTAIKNAEDLLKKYNHII